jgi:hypothetical protein
MKSLINFDKNILKEYALWENTNKENWNITSYLNQFYDVNAALAFSKLYFPDFIEERGCIILGFRYNQDVFNQWYEEFKGEAASVERYCNLYEVADYFHINASEYGSEEIYKKSIEIFSNVLKTSWEVNCKILFPKRQIKVEELEEYGVKRITLYTQAFL